MVESLPPEGRQLTDREATLVRWLLEHGTPPAHEFLPQVADARVVAHCPCGCASVDFAIGGIVPPPTSGMQILADYCWQADGGANFGIFVFAREDRLAGLEVWSIDGEATPTTLPVIDKLKPLVTSVDRLEGATWPSRT